MKYIVLAVATASLFSLAGILGLRYLQESRVSHTLDSRLEELSSGIGTNAESIASLLSEVNQMRDQLRLKSPQSLAKTETSTDVESGNLVKRIQVLEDNMRRFADVESPSTPGRREAMEKLLSASSHMSGDTSAYSQRQFAAAESDFENDSGTPLGDYKNAISEALHAQDSFQVKGVDCKNTICRITYSESDSLISDDGPGAESDLVAKLAQAVEGVGVEVRYANDPYGNEVMYIQLR